MSTKNTSKVVGIKDAAIKTGLSEWELMQGAKSGKYPHMRAGGSRGKYLFNIDMLTERIDEIMMENCRYRNVE